MATIELGGSTPISYYMDCTTSVNNGAQLMWSRVLDNNPFRVQQINNGTRLVIPTKTQSSSLGIYQCADSATSEVTVLNITDGMRAICTSSLFHLLSKLPLLPLTLQFVFLDFTLLTTPFPLSIHNYIIYIHIDAHMLICMHSRMCIHMCTHTHSSQPCCLPTS